MRKPGDPTDGFLLTVSLGTDTPVGEPGRGGKNHTIGMGKSTAVRENKSPGGTCGGGVPVRSEGHAERTPGVVK